MDPEHRHPNPMPKDVYKMVEGVRAMGPECLTCTSLLRQQLTRCQAR